LPYFTIPLILIFRAAIFFTAYEASRCDDVASATRENQASSKKEGEKSSSQEEEISKELLDAGRRRRSTLLREIMS
jgi:hypothetical protein